ncbi:choice-of-anchor I family protein [Stieleria sp. ICT_E10.1]|uniref:choice-of-anchor I family protein n=1 Tax=Stieleria sedimenti TaxID=2976331 RepID=UPI0021802972|nr:choice-of-anchor I family protein [Stieleria sedimenti]MCS7466604.1 choice-of-anchor I family protein [Stieleria sedimenti]
MNKHRTKDSSSRSKRRRPTQKHLKLESLEARQLLAANVVNDSLTLAADSAINVLTNDTSGSEVQSVSAFQVDFDRATYDAAVNATDWFIPDRPGQPGVPQRSLIPGAVTSITGNRGDLDLHRDNDADPSNDTELAPLTADEGISLPVLRDNQPVDSTQTNLGVLQYVVDAASTWIAMAAAPENNGESSVPISNTFFPYDAGWAGATIDEGGVRVFGSTDISASGDGRNYVVEVAGVTDSFEDGFLFSIAGDNSDNYSRARPIGGNQWAIQVRDNSQEIASTDTDPISVLYIPRSAQGLIGGVVDGGFEGGVSPMLQSFGDFSVSRPSDGFYRVSIPGHDVTSGALIIENHDLSVSQPRNTYFSYDDAGDGSGDIIIRQFAWNGNTETPLNSDFVFFFVPFENTLSPTTDLTVSSLGENNNGLSAKGLPLTLNADGTVNYATSGAIRALGAGETDSDTFVYRATDGTTESAEATVTVHWVGINDAPEVISTPADLILNEDDAATVLDLTAIFSDVDTNDVLTYGIDTGVSGLVSGEIVGTDVSITPALNQFGYVQISLSATDTSGEIASVTLGISVIPQDDDVQAVDDDGTVTDKLTPARIDVLGNDFHPDTTEFSVSAAEIYGDPAATTNEDSVFSVINTTAAPNDLTIQSAGNLGDVAVGRGGFDLSLADGVFLGTGRDNTSPFPTVNTYAAFGSYGFATDRGIGGGERNTALSAAFFPFGDQWTSGHIAADGTVLGGVGISQANVTLLQPGLFEITIPEASFTDDGLLFAVSGSNDDNIVSVYPQGFNNKWLVRQIDSDSDATGFESDPISFVYLPGSTSGLIGGRAAAEEGQYTLRQSYGNVTLGSDTDLAPLVSINGYTPADGALIAIATSFDFADVNGSSTLIPANQAVMATPQGNDFRLDILQSQTFTPTGNFPEFQFIFLPYDSPLEKIDGLDFSIDGFDSLSALGASVTLEADGTFTYDPSGAGAPIADLGNGESTTDTFTYTIRDGRGGTSTATVSVTVQGENQAPTANDDVVNLNELNAQGALITVLGNDVDPDVESLLGTPTGIPSANLSVDAASVWSVSQTGTAPVNLTLGDFSTGTVEILQNGNAINQADGVVLATIRENFDGANTNYRLVQAFDNGSGTSLALQQFGTDAAADADVSVAFFPFADNWVGGHVSGGGTLTHGSGLTDAEVVRTDVGRYEVSIPGVTDAALDGFLFVIGNENADNVAQARAVPGSSVYEVAVRDNQQDFGNGEDGGFSFVFVPRNAQNLVAGAIDPFNSGPNAVSLAVGEFSVERLDVTDGGHEWKVTIPGQSPDTGMLILTNQDNGEIEDNFLSYQDDGAGSFLIRSQDMPGLGRQDERFTFTFIPFDSIGQPAARPVPGLLSIDSVDPTSSLGATLTANADGTIRYDPGTVLDSLYEGETATDTFTYTMTDGFGGTATATVTVNIDGFGTAPVLQASSGATYYGVGDEAISIDGQFNVAPVGVPFFDGAAATVELTSGQIASDTLSIRDEGNGAGQVGVSGSDISFDGVVVASFTGGSGTTPLTVTFNAAATELAVDRILQSVTYVNSDPVLTGGSRTTTFSFVDGNGRASDSVTKQLELGLVYRRELQQGVNLGYGTYQGTSDAQIREADPDSVIAPGSDLLVDFDSGGNASQVLLRYDNLFGDGPGQIPLGSVITSANLVVETNPNTSNAPGDGANLHRMSIDWDDATATWNAFGNGIQPGTGEAAGAFESQIGTASGAGSTGTGLLSFSVLPDLQAWADGETNHGWLMQGWQNLTDGWFFSSAEDETPTARPKLEIEWVPAGANVVSFREGVNGYSSTVDTEIDSATADDDLSSAETLFIDSPTSRALIRFDDIIGDLAGQVPAGSRIITARLRTASSTSNAQGDGARFFPMLTSWDDTDTFNSLVDGVNIDGVEAASEYTAFAGNASLNPNVQGGFHDWDVTSDVQAWVNGDLTNFGWLFEPWEGGTDGWGVQSSEAANEIERPRLEIVFTAAIDPEINITGDNGQAVAAGTTNVSPLAGTDFGSADVAGGTVTKTFTIENTGAAALNISAAEVIGAEAGAFSFTNQPVATVIPGGSFSFDLVFDPSKLGLHDATVVITSDDADEGVYQFAIQGNGVGFPALSATPDGSTSFTAIGGISSGLSGAEISAFDPGSDRLFVTSDAGLQVINLSNPANPVLLSTIQPTAEGASDNAITSVAVNQAGVVAVAVPGSDPQAPGNVFFYNAADSAFLGSVTVGALPDQLTFTPDGSRLLVANEGEASSAAVPAMATGQGGFQVEPIFTVGETLSATTGALNATTAGDYVPPGVLDGLGAYELDGSTVRVFATHELLSTRGYDYTVTDGAGGSLTLEGARISYFDIDKATRQIVDGGLAYDTIYDATGAVATDNSFLANNFTGFSRFCSAVLIEPHQFGAGQGTEDRIFFAGEEDGGGFNSVGGAEWALDVATGEIWHVPAMGRGAWENITEVDTGTTTHVAFLLSDDTSPFDADPLNDEGREAAPIYLYVGQKDAGGDFLARNGLRDGSLFVWVADNGTVDPTDFNALGGTPTSLGGAWVELESGIMTGGNPNTPSEDGSSGFDEYGYPTQRTLWLRAEAVGAFGFSRPEDVATNPAMGNQVVLASTGVDNYVGGVDTFGTIYTITTDFTNLAAPTATIDIIYDGDADLTRALRSPDNLDWADDGFIYIQEDKAENATLLGEPLFGAGATNPSEAGIVRLDPATGETVRVASIDRSIVLDPSTSGTPFDTDAGVTGQWETSGILDVSTLFGEIPGSLFLFDIQAHGIEDQTDVNTDSRINDNDLVEGGQLAFLNSNPSPAADPVGSVSIIDLSGGVATATVQTAGFAAFDGSEQALRDAGVKLSPGKSVSQDVEPEYIAVSADGTTARVTLQENNAFADVDLATATITRILPLGYKDHNAANAQIDPTNNSPDALTLGSFPVRGLFQPDAIASYQVDGVTYYVTANEGDARDAEETDVQSVTLDPTMFPNAAALQSAASAGELELSGIVGDPDGDGDFDALYSFGARSFSIWNEAGDMVFDSGDVLARATGLLGLYPDGRSDNKGTEPEGVTIGQIDGRTYAFVGLERANAIMVFDVTDPTNVTLSQVLHDTADVSPEGLTFISSSDSPSGSPLLVVSNEVSNTLRVYAIGSTPATPQVESVVINDGSASRSQITSVTVTFDTEVDHAALQSAFTLTNVDTSTQVTGLDIAANNSGGKTIAVLSFAAGASVVTRNGSGLQGNSLADGNYRLDIAGTQVRATAGATAMAVDYAFGGHDASGTPNDDFFRLLGDANGDGFRNGIDLNSIIPSLFNPNEYRFDLDTNGDGSINGIDLNDLIPTIFGSPRQ